jgi:hypothetical protein
MFFVIAVQCKLLLNKQTKQLSHLGPPAAPTPGARAILNTFAREKRDDSGGSPSAATAVKSAKDLLREHRQALARAEKPVLGWGLSAGASIVSLDISPSQAGAPNYAHRE